MTSKEKKTLLKISCATSVVIFNLAVVFAGCMAWFTCIRTQSPAADGMKVFSSTLGDAKLILHDVTKTSDNELNFTFNNNESTATALSEYDRYKVNLTPCALVLEFQLEIGKDCVVSIDAKAKNDWLAPVDDNFYNYTVINEETSTSIVQRRVDNYISNVCKFSYASVSATTTTGISEADVSIATWTAFSSQSNNIWSKEDVISLGNIPVSQDNPSIYFVLTYNEESALYFYNEYSDLGADYINYLSDIDFYIREANEI